MVLHSLSQQTAIGTTGPFIVPFDAVASSVANEFAEPVRLTFASQLQVFIAMMIKAISLCCADKRLRNARRRKKKFWIAKFFGLSEAPKNKNRANERFAIRDSLHCSMPSRAFNNAFTACGFALPPVCFIT